MSSRGQSSTRAFASARVSAGEGGVAGTARSGGDHAVVARSRHPAAAPWLTAGGAKAAGTAGGWGRSAVGYLEQVLKRVTTSITFKSQATGDLFMLQVHAGLCSNWQDARLARHPRSQGHACGSGPTLRAWTDEVPQAPVVEDEETGERLAPARNPRSPRAAGQPAQARLALDPDDRAGARADKPISSGACEPKGDCVAA